MAEHAFMDTTSDVEPTTIRFVSTVVPVDESRLLLISKNGPALVLAISVGEDAEKVRLVWPFTPTDTRRLRDFLNA